MKPRGWTDLEPGGDAPTRLTSEALDADELSPCPAWTRRRATPALVGFAMAEAGVLCRKRARNDKEAERDGTSY
jgi:hypothetical protein